LLKFFSWRSWRLGGRKRFHAKTPRTPRKTKLLQHLFQLLIRILTYDTLLNRQKIPNTIGRDLNPSWSNDGQKIAFAVYPTNRLQPYFFY